MTDSILARKYIEGGDLSADAVEKLEKVLAKNPSDFHARASLLGYYVKAKRGSSGLAKHMGWLIQNAPEHQIMSLPILFSGETALAQHLSKLWHEATSKEQVPPKALLYASIFHLSVNPPLAVSLLERACELDSEDCDLKLKLLDAYSMASPDLPDSEKKKNLSSAINVYEQLPDRHLKSKVVGVVAEIAFDAKEFSKASHYAEETLNLSDDLKENWNYGNNIHLAHTILGLVALASGDEETACLELIESAKTPGSPQLDSFGPDFSLANDLLERGHKEAVWRFLMEVRKFWMEADLIDRWIDEINAGEIPYLSVMDLDSDFD